MREAIASRFTAAAGRGVLRLAWLAAAVSVHVLAAAPARAQEWGQYLGFEDAFSVNFPGEPDISQTTYATQYGVTLPARVYAAADALGAYSVTAVDWREAPQLHEALDAACRATVGDLRGGDNPGICGNRLRIDIMGAMLHAAYGFLTRGSEVTLFSFTSADGVSGVRVQLLNADGSRTYAAIHWHEFRLYIVEGTAPQGMPPPSAFPVSIGFIDEYGRRIQYQEDYAPLFPVPPRSR